MGTLITKLLEKFFGPWDWEEVVAKTTYFFVTTSLSLVSFLLTMALTAPGTVRSCHVNSTDHDRHVVVLSIDWRQDEQVGPFKTLDEALQAIDRVCQR